MNPSQLIVMDDLQALYVRAAEEITHFAGEAICTHGEFTLCLSGGSTPAATYELMATRFKLSVDWKEVQFFWGDERCVPPTDPASNYEMANRTMLSKLALMRRSCARLSDSTMKIFRASTSCSWASAITLTRSHSSPATPRFTSANV